MKSIPLTQGFFALVDDADYDKVSAFKWYAKKSRNVFYAQRNLSGRPRRKQYLHQFLLPGASEIAHMDGDGLNNQRYNIRPCSHTQNTWGYRRAQAGASSRYRGVTRVAKTGKWKAQISVHNKKISLGYFGLETDAALAYDTAARKHYGEWASPNVV